MMRDFTAGTLLGCCLTTGMATILNTAGTRPGHSVLVIGCGGVGLGTVQAARIAGAALIIAALAPGGRAVVVGMMPPGSRIALPARLLRHGRSMAGSVMGEVRTRHDISAYLQMAASGRLVTGDLATSARPLDQVNDAFSHAAAKRGIRTMIEF